MTQDAGQRPSKKFRGFFNRYQKSKGLGKYLIEDLRCLFTLIYLYLKNGFRVPILFVYPHYPSKRSTVYRIAGRLGYFLTNKPHPRARLAIYWEYQTFRQEFAPLESFADAHRIPVINRWSRDISKLYVDQAFQAVFGYSTQIDPTTFQGRYVEKSDINAKHDGRVLDQPLAKREADKIYQILIDNAVEGDMVKDFRVPLYGGEIPFVFVKYRSIGERFKNSTIKTELYPAEELFSAEEIVAIKAFAARIQLDHGELDVLRDKHTQLIYIVDVNNTPQSPPANCEAALEAKAIALMSESFARQFLAAGSKN